MPVGVKERGGKAAKTRSARYAEFVEFFYQVHYRLGMTLESAMCDGRVSRTQAAVLWLVAFGIGPDGTILRKDIERSLREWYETSNSNVSKILRELAKPPLRFIVQSESPHSGREKIISLTAEGSAFVQSMKNRGHDYFNVALRHMDEDVMAGGAKFFTQLFSVPLTPANNNSKAQKRRGSPALRRN